MCNAPEIYHNFQNNWLIKLLLYHTISANKISYKLVKLLSPSSILCKGSTETQTHTQCTNVHNFQTFATSVGKKET